jgi:hypothetical protein
MEMRFPGVQRTNRNHMLLARFRSESHAGDPICCRHLVYGKRMDNANASEEETTGWSRDGVCFPVHEILLIADLSPTERRGPARSSAEILTRINKMLFNSSLMRESRALSFVSRLIDDSNIPEGTLRKIRLHSDVSRHVVARLGVASQALAGFFQKAPRPWRQDDATTSNRTPPVDLLMKCL